MKKYLPYIGLIIIIIFVIVIAFFPKEWAVKRKNYKLRLEADSLFMAHQDSIIAHQRKMIEEYQNSDTAILRKYEKKYIIIDHYNKSDIDSFIAARYKLPS